MTSFDCAVEVLPEQEHFVPDTQESESAESPVEKQAASSETSTTCCDGTAVPGTQQYDQDRGVTQKECDQDGGATQSTDSGPYVSESMLAPVLEAVTSDPQVELFVLHSQLEKERATVAACEREKVQLKAQLSR